MSEQPNSATVNFRLTRIDVFRALSHSTLRRMWFLLLLPIVGAASIVWALLDPDNGAVTLGNGLWLFVFGSFVFCGAPWLRTRTAMKNPNFAGPLTFTASERGIDFTGEHSSGTIGWPMVRSVSETRKAIYINIKPDGMQIIPRDRLSAAELAAFRTVLRTHVPAATPITTTR